MTEPSTIAVVGTGSIGSRHLRILKENLHLDPIAIPKRHDRQNFWLAQGYKASAVLPEIKTGAIGLAIIASNTSCHLNDSLDALEKGYHLLVEKPLCTTFEESLALYDRYKRSSAKIFTGFDLRFSTSLNAFKTAIIQLGEVYSVRIECQSWLPDWRPDRPYKESYSASKKEGGVLRDLVHDIDYASWIFGFPKRVQAKIKNFNILEIEAEEFIEVFWETDGPVVSICLDYITKPTKRVIRAHGRQGSIIWDAINQKIISIIDGEENIREYAQDVDSLYEDELKSFIRSCRHDDFKCDRLASLEDGVHVDAICEAIRNGAREKKEYEVHYQL